MATTSENMIEIEQKFAVDEATPLPLLHELPGVDRVEQPVEHRLEAVYFDTKDLVLAANHITLRRRTGGDDAGWHLKLPEGSDGRREIREPLGEDPELVPRPLLQWVRVYVRDEALAPIAKLQTRRIVHRLRSTDSILADVSDDHVQAETLGPGAGSTQWREWEIELVDGQRELLESAQVMFAEAGVRPAAQESKLAHALGDRPLEGEPEAPQPRRKGAAADVVLAYLHQQVSQLKLQDPQVRHNVPDALHQMRVATRRMRSSLATYRKLLDTDTANQLRDELKWLAGVLGAARDAEVMHDRLRGLVSREPAELVMGPVERRIDLELEADYNTAHANVLEVLDQQRYFRLLDALDSLLAEPPLADLASKPAHKVVPKLVKHDMKRLRKAVKATNNLTDPGNEDPALHETRKCAKRLRYAAEAAEPVGGKRAERLAEAAHGVQKVLGDHQDSVVDRGLLQRLGGNAFLAGENGFSFGRLHGLEQAAAARSEAKFRRKWDKFPSASLKK